MSNLIARGTVGLILGYYVALFASTLASFFAWPTAGVKEASIVVTAMSIFGMIAGATISLFTHRVSWVVFGVTTGPAVGLASGLISTTIIWTQYASSYSSIARNPTVDAVKGSLIGLVTGLIIGVVVGYITNFIFRIPSRNSLDTPSLGSQKKNYVPTGIAKLLILLLSFLVSLGGIIIGLLYLKRPDSENQQFAKQVFIISGAGFIFWIIFRALVSNGLS